VDWWIVVVVAALVLMLLPYTFLIFKFAGAGWIAGIRGYIRATQERKK
jgi:hypothetical protein